MNCQRADESSKNFCETEPASSSEIFRFANGDIENVLSDGTVTYYYDEIATTQTTYPDGLQVFEFPNGQEERYFVDGGCEIIFPDSTQKNIHSSGITEVIYPDGLCVTEDLDGTKRISQILKSPQKSANSVGTKG
eukprot:CAMPEP_0172431154 /NCGR_PEP_ID=MMETSP1064-20121228/57390_1 /TAXON_ID=202472 /ORGANISM="Aulacoseira subarctica , Strain CCAP 1002/5" /LENGTH=134 /DNA_ID=CAMNT_0013177665 /DNA_START=97 /DNA_END=501 /DNA_ORIENTATION=-